MNASDESENSESWSSNLALGGIFTFAGGIKVWLQGDSLMNYFRTVFSSSQDIADSELWPDGGSVRGILGVLILIVGIFLICKGFVAKKKQNNRR